MIIHVTFRSYWYLGHYWTRGMHVVIFYLVMQHLYSALFTNKRALMRFNEKNIKSLLRNKYKNLN